MKKNPFSYLLWIFCLFFSGSLVYAQEPVQKKITIENLFLLVVENNPSLSVSKTDVKVAEQAVKVSKDMRLPDVNFNASALYIGDGTILDKDFSNATKVELH